MSERENLILLGRIAGTCTGYDRVDDNALIFYEFEPVPGWMIPLGDLTVDYEGGWLLQHDDNGVEITKTDISVLMALPRAPER